VANNDLITTRLSHDNSKIPSEVQASIRNYADMFAGDVANLNGEGQVPAQLAGSFFTEPVRIH